MLRIIEFAHDIISKKINSESICVDMTIGNGNDTLFLAKKSKFVYGFDIQNIALENTTKLLKENNINNYKLFLSSHEKIDEFINEKIDLFIYNLGYLPKGDKSITTNYDSTITSLIKSMNLLNEKGMIVLVIYPGHPQGKIEEKKVLEFASKIKQSEFEVVTYRFINQVNNPPFVLIIERK